MMKYFLTVGVVALLAGCQLQTNSTVVTPASNTNSNTTTNTTVTTNTNVVPDNQTFWLEYHPAQCEQLPWTADVDSTVIAAYYQATYNITVDAIELTGAPDGFFSCQACGCPTGATISLQTDAAGKVVLLQNGFTDPEVSVPEAKTNVNTNPAVTTNPNTNTTTSVQAVDASSEPDLSADDQAMKDRVGLVQSYLADYFQTKQSYPNDLVGLQNVDLTDIHYTPIGSIPATYYDLSVDYSTGRVVVNP